MRVALVHFFSLAKKNPDCLKTIDKGRLLELVGVADRYRPTFQFLAEWYKTHGFTGGKPDREKLRKLDVPSGLMIGGLVDRGAVASSFLAEPAIYVIEKR